MNRRIVAVLCSLAGLLLLGSVLIAFGSRRAGIARPAPRAAAAPEPFLWELTDLCAWLTNGTAPIPLDEAALERARAAGNVAGILAIEKRLSVNLLGHNRADDAIEHLERALELANETAQPADEIADVEFNLGLALLRRGEVSHCIEKHNPESCLFPIQGKGLWDDPSSALAALEHFLACLKLDPSNHGARWLLNVAAMAAGAYPESVPKELVMGPPPPDPEGPQWTWGRFRDVAGELGVDTFDGAGGAVLDDIDGDGWLDIVSTSIDPCEPMHFYHNEGDGTFANWSERSRLAEQLGGLNLYQADYDNDGRLDFFVPRGAWMSEEYGRQRRSLLHQEEGCVFADTTKRAGLGENAFPCQASGWGDYDSDGDLDLYVGNERYPCELFQNQGDGTFADVTAKAGVPNGGMTKGVAWGDYDNDGDQDLYVSNLEQSNLLYRNEGDGTFREIAHELGVDVGHPDEAPHLGNKTFTTWFFDYDNDGWLDLYVGGYGSSLSAWAADYAGLPTTGNRLRLYKNEGGRFRNVTREVGLYRILLPMGANYGDVDSDGFPDIFLGTGKPGFEFLIPKMLYRNVSGRRFADVTTEAGVGHLQKGHGVAFGDVDHDGDQDLFAQMGAFYPADAFRDAFYENPGNGNHWITIVLRGVRTNRFGIGARIRADVTTAAGPRSIHALAGAGGSFGGSSLQQEIGLGDAEEIDRLEIWWPASGVRQVLEHVAVDQFVAITEGEPGFQVLERPRIRLAAQD